MSRAAPRPAALLAIAIASIALFFLVKSVAEVLAVNDFEVFHAAARSAAAQDPDLYGMRSAVKGRPFLYPPASAFLMIPLGWAPHDAAGVLFCLLRGAALAFLVVGGIRWSGAAPADRTGFLLVALAVIVALFRPIDSDASNGQVNAVVAALGVGGAWLALGSRRAWWIGSALLAAATALKLTPVLLAGLLVLHRRWAALGLFVALAAALLVGVPRAWWGTDAAVAMAAEHRTMMASYFTDARDSDRLTTPNELIQFTLAQSRAVGRGYETHERELHRRAPGGALVPAQLPEPMSPESARLVVLAIAAIAGLGFFAARRRIFGGDPTWDLAMLAALVVVLAPRTRKAHMVILIVPVAWIACRIWWIVLRGELARRKAALACAALAFAGLLAANDLAIPLPGFPMPYRAGMFIGLVGIVSALLLLRDAPGATNGGAVLVEPPHRRSPAA